MLKILSFFCLFLVLIYPINKIMAQSNLPIIYETIPLRIDKTDLKFSKKWDGVKDDILVKTPEIKNVLIYTRKLSLRDKVLSINVSVNSYVYYKAELEGSDHWQSANETLKLGTGDCEDYAILKYRLLVESGVNPNQIFLVIGKYSNIGHAELIVVEGDNYYVMDNSYSDLSPMEGFKPILSIGSKYAYYHIN